ncbi:MAG: hypothetical protein IPG82_06900 [Saprospiraceae bacterium]|nr:hypothetical protein [Saprospiraceae bacterium]
MNKIQNSFYVIGLCLILNACVHESIEAVSTGPYNFNPMKTTVSWTAYKYTSKLGVSGDLPDIIFKPSIKSVEDQKDIKNILTDFQFESEPNLIKGEATSLRNQNIQTYFFNKLSYKKISAKVLSIKSTNTEGGLLSLELIFNGVKKIYDANYSIIDNTIELRCHLELADFDAMNALNALHDQVGDLHQGPDGIPMTWPDVDILVVSELD